MFIYDEEMKLINECEFLEDKLNFFSIYLDISSIIIENQGKTLGEQYCHGMMKAYLKIFIESLNAPITEKEFTQGLIKGIKQGKLIDHFVVLDTLSLYETDTDLLKSNMPYVAEVGFMNKDIAQKERFVIRVRSILKEIFDNMDKRLAGWNSLIFLKDKISSSVSANIKAFIAQSSSLEDLKRLIKEQAVKEVYHAYKADNCDYAYIMLDSTGFFNNPLDYTDIKLAGLLCACILVNDKANVHPIFLQKMLDVNCNELKYRLQKIDSYILAMLNKSDASIDNNKKMN